VTRQPCGRPLSTVFGSTKKEAIVSDYDEDDDPVLAHLRFLDYRYIRFCYQPIEDKFLLSNSWKDPLWTNAKTLRGGLDADERDRREQVFGGNVIDVEQKSIPNILVDEVSPRQGAVF
jgi:cation-transporting ATPase 13A3/4/5